MAFLEENGLSTKLIQDFKEAYPDIKSGISEHVEEVKKILSDAVTAGAFRAIPITSRMKELESALGSLQRRQADRLERQKLKERMEASNGDWELYWKGKNKLHKVNKWGRFKDVESMVDALHDFGGVRICVYFPEDVEKVVSFLEQNGKTKAVQNVRKNQDNVEMADLRQRVETLEQRQPSERQLEKSAEEGVIEEKVSVGYRATHVVVELVGDALPEGHENRHRKIEIQIATVVMHAWAQIEHDIIYKPYENEPDDEVKNILDVFNGLVLSSEGTLKQLAAINARKEKDRARDEDAKARNTYELGMWIADHYDKLGTQPALANRSPTWYQLDKLLSILRSSGDHTSGKVKDLLKKVRDDEKPIPAEHLHDLPLHLLRALFTSKTKEILQFSSDEVSDLTQKTVAEARNLAFKTVQSINMASYLGVQRQFISAVEQGLPSSSDLPRPSIIDFLDLLHPQHPRLDQEAEEKIIRFCQAFLDRKSLRKVIKSEQQLLRIELPLLLTDISRVVSPIAEARTVGDDVPIVVPRILCEILADPEHVHWIPEIFTKAEQMSRFPLDFKEPVILRSDGSLLEFLTSSPLSSVNDLSSHFGGEFFLLSNTKSHTVRLHGRIEKGSSHWFAYENAEDTLPSWHIKKSLPPGKDMQTGYFAPMRSDTNAPRWWCIAEQQTEWSVNTIDMCKVIVAQSIKKVSHKSPFIDFASYLRPEYNMTPKSESSDGPVEYSFHLPGCTFILKSPRKVFILKRKPPTTGGPLAAENVIQESEVGRTVEDREEENQADDDVETVIGSD